MWDSSNCAQRRKRSLRFLAAFSRIFLSPSRLSAHLPMLSVGLEHGLSPRRSTQDLDSADSLEITHESTVGNHVQA